MGVRIAFTAFLAAVVAASAVGSSVFVAQERGELEAWLDGVHAIAAPGVPGPIAVFGERAFPVVVGRTDGDHRAAAVAATRAGSGRIVVFAHSGYASVDAARAGETALFVRHAIEWLAPKKERAILGTLGGWSGAVRAAGFTPRELDGRDPFARLEEIDVLATSLLSLSDADMQRLAAFVEHGGGLLGSDTGWGWQQLNPEEPLDEQPIQRWLAHHGLAFTLDYLERTHEHGFAVDGPPAAWWNADRALDLLVAAAKPRAAKAGAPTVVATDELGHASWTVGFAARALPDFEVPFGVRLARLVREHERDLVATETKPLGRDRPLERALVGAQWTIGCRTSADSLRAHASAVDFPGAVDARIGMQALELDCSVPGWRSLGLWANPGARVTVQLPAAALAAGLRVRIGPHTDELWHLDEWKRLPAITREFALVAESTTCANAFGGLVYLVVPPGAKSRLPPGTLRVVLRGVVPAPHFVLGSTSDEDWRNARKRPAPWAELESSKLVLTVPSRVVRELADPRGLMEFWDRVLDAQAELAGIPAARPRPERFVLDRQIAAGYMHSGYPIMTHLDVAELVVDRARLETGEELWGLVHELGHNLQVGDWTFEGTGEVTNNLFALYAIEKACKLAPGRRGHDAVNSPPSIAAYLERGAPFDEWKQNPFLALETFTLVQAEFGWEPFRAVFAEYAKLADAERPKDDAEKRDQWLVRLSRAVDRDLGPYFEAWGVPISAAARAQVAALPDWMPATWPTR